MHSLRVEIIKHVPIFLNNFLGSIENLQVEFEGETYALQEIAQIGRKGPQLLVVNLTSFPTVIKDVLKAITNSGMGLNPQQDGTTLFIPVPKYISSIFISPLKKNYHFLFFFFQQSYERVS